MPKSVTDALSNTSVLLLIRIFQLIGTPALLGMVGWGITSVHALQESVVRLETQMTERTSDRYTASDARRDRDTVNQIVAGLERRIMLLEDRRPAR